MSARDHVPPEEAHASPATGTAYGEIERRIVDCRLPPVHLIAPPVPANTLRGIGLFLRTRWTRRALGDAVLRRIRRGRRSRLCAAIVRARGLDRFRDDAFWRRWLGSADPAEREAGAFFAALAEPERAVPPDLRPRPGDLFVVGPGVDPRLLARLDWPPDRSASVIDLAPRLAEADADEPYAELSPRLLERAVEETWFADARAAAEAAAPAMLRALPDGAFARFAARQRPLLQMHIKHAVATVLRQVTELRRQVEAARPRRIVVLEGAFPGDAFVAACRAAAPDAPVELVCVDPASRLRFARRAEPSIPPDDDAGAALERAAGRFRALRGFGAWRGAIVLAVDLRQRNDFRHRSMSLALIRTAATRRPVVVLQSYQQASRATLKAVRVGLGEGGWTSRLALLRIPHAAPADANGGHPAPWRTPMLRAAARALAATPAIEEWRRPAALEAIGVALTSFLPGMLASVRALSDQLRQGAVATIGVPSGKMPQAMLAAAAREADVPSLEVFTLMIGTSERDNPPLADHVSVIDDAQMNLICARFGIDPERVILGGREDFAAKRALKDRRAAFAAPPFEILYVSQPLGDIADRTLLALAAAVERRPDVRLTMVPHPDELPAARAAYRARLEPLGPRARLHDGQTTDDLVAASDLVVTMASNVALHAAVMERPVLVIDLSAERLPLRFDEYGIALAAESEDEVAPVLARLIDDPQTRARLAESRARFLVRNPQFLAGSASGRLLDFLEAQVAKRQAGTDPA